MSQDIRDYRLERVDKVPREARQLSVTATVGPTVHEQPRGVQLTLETEQTHSYARLTQQQVYDLIEVLLHRVNPGAGDWEATLYGSGRATVLPDGSLLDTEDQIDE